MIDRIALVGPGYDGVWRGMKRASVTASEKRKSEYGSYLVDVDDGLPEVVLLLVEARRRKLAQGHSYRGGNPGIDLLSHTNLTEETGVVLVDVGSVVVLTTGHTTTTRMLPVLADTTLTGRHVATAVGRRENWLAFHDTFKKKRKKSSRSISQPPAVRHSS